MTIINIAALGQLADQAAKKHGVNPILLRAIIQIESSWVPWAMRFEPGYKDYFHPLPIGQLLRVEMTFQATSYGLGQIMGANLRAMGFDGDLYKALDPITNLDYTAKFLVRLCNRWPNVEDTIAAYNHGHPEMTNGHYTNQAYVDRVSGVMKNLQGTIG